MNPIEKAESELQSELNASQVRATSVNSTDYLVSLAGFLYYEGKRDPAMDLLQEIEDDPLADYFKVACRFNVEGWNEELKSLVQRFDQNANPIAGKVLAMYDRDLDDVTTVSLLRRAAFAGDPVSMLRMAEICHDGNVRKGRGLLYVPRGTIRWQDRRQECWWREFHLRNLKSANYPVMYHAFNQMEGSYDRSYSTDEINDTLLIAAALGSDQAVDYLISYFTKNKDDLKRLEKSLFWLYYKKEKYGLNGREEGVLREVEERIKK